MKQVVLLISLIFPFFAHAEPVQCAKYQANLVTKNCALNIAGSYQLNVCNNDQGTLTKQDGSVKYLFKTSNIWSARQDSWDFTHNLATTEVLQVNNELTSFSISKVKTKQNGTVVERANCSGTIELQLLDTAQ
jgi:hypothetical protein